MVPASASAKARGRQLLAGIDAPLDAITPSSFTFSDIEKNGWYMVEDDYDNEEPTAEARREMSEFFCTNQESPEEFVSVKWRHDASSETWARYYALYNVSNGTIISTDCLSPRFARKDAEEDEYDVLESLPALEHWSDVTFLQWEKLCKGKGEAAERLKRVVVSTIVNEATKATIERIFGSASRDHPGRTFTYDQDEFLELLSTANAQGLAYLLGQHKHESQLGQKSIVSVQVFYKQGDNKGWYMDFQLSVKEGDDS